MIIKTYAWCIQSQTFKSLPVYLRNLPEFWKMAMNVFNQLEGNFFWLKNFRTGQVGGTTLEFHVRKWF